MSAGTAGLAPGFKEKVDAWVAAGHGAFTVTSGFRTKSEQVALRKANGCPDVYTSPPSACKVRPTAIPGTSAHERGLAVDVSGNTALAARLAPQFGLAATVAGDPNHYESTTAMNGVPQQSGGAFAGATASAVGAVSSEGIVDKAIDGLRRILITAVILGGGAALLAAGVYRASTGRSLAAKSTQAAGKGLTHAAEAAVLA